MSPSSRGRSKRLSACPRGGNKAATYYVLFELTQVADFIEWVGMAPGPNESGLRSRLHSVFQPVAAYFLAAMEVTQVFSVGLAVLALPMPVFVMFSLVAIVDGLVKRHLRRWGGGRESSFVYHWAKHSALPLLVLTWVVYLALPLAYRLLGKHLVHQQCREPPGNHGSGAGCWASSTVASPHT